MSNLLRKTLNTICTFHRADYAYLLIVKSYKSASPIAFYNHQQNKIKQVISIEFSDIYIDLKEHSILISLLNVSPDADLIIANNFSELLKSNQLRFGSNQFVKENLFKIKMHWNDIKSTIYTSVRINNFLNGVLCLGSTEINHDFLPLQPNPLLTFSYSFNIMNSLFKASEALFTEFILTKNQNSDIQVIKPEKLYNENAFFSIEENYVEALPSEDPNYFLRLAQLATKILEAERTHVFIKEKGIRNEKLFKDQILQKKEILNLHDKDIDTFVNNKISFYTDKPVLSLVGHDFESSTYYLINEKNLGAITWGFIKKAEEIISKGKIREVNNKKMLSEDDLFFAVYDIKKINFSSHMIAQNEELNSVLSILLYDENNNEIEGVISIYSKWKEPMFNYHRRELISLTKMATDQLIELKNTYKARKRASEIKDRIENEVMGKIDEVRVENINSYLNDLVELSDIYNKKYISYKEKVIPILNILDDLLFKRNCTPYYLSNISIRDIKFFGDFDWVFDKNINIVLGNNGYGKSYLFRTIVSMLQNKQENLKQFFSAKTDEKESKIELKLLKNEFYSIDKKETATIYFNESGFKKENSILSMGIFPILAIPDVRYARQSNSIGSTFGNLSGDLKKVGANAFLNRQPFENFIEEFLNDLCLTFLDKKSEILEQQSNNNSNNILKNGELTKHIFSTHPKFVLLKNVMDDLTGDKSFEFDSIERITNGSGFSFLVKTNESSEKIPIQQVSQGTMSILAIFGLIYRYLNALYPKNTIKNENLNLEELKLLKGVVIIDEIDAHLHPKWQQKIVYLLQKYFSNIQFFISAHNPLVVAGSKYGEVSILYKSSDKFYINNLSDINFVGVDPKEIYEDTFLIRNKDLTYRSYLTQIPQLKQKEHKLQEISEKDSLTAVDIENLTSLREDINLIKKIINTLDEDQID